MVTVIGIKKWDNMKGDWDYLPGKCTVERFDELAALSDTDRKPCKIEGSEEEVELSDIDADGWYNPNGRERR